MELLKVGEIVGALHSERSKLRESQRARLRLMLC